MATGTKSLVISNISITEHPLQHTKQERLSIPNIHSSQQYNVFDSNGETTELPNNAIPIEARHTVFELYTMEQYSILPTPPAPPSSQIRSVQQVEGPNMAGSDGSVHPVKGDRACAYIVCNTTV